MTSTLKVVLSEFGIGRLDIGRFKGTLDPLSGHVCNSETEQVPFEKDQVTCSVANILLRSWLAPVALQRCQCNTDSIIVQDRQ